MKRSGTADLPLHGGRVPGWLAERMTALGTAIAEAIVLDYGPSEFLTRLSDPYWFQALGSVMGMDWHSSGITTSVMGALKRGLNPRAADLGLYICGGRGRHSRRTPDELRARADCTGLDGESLVRISRLTARVDNNAIADGFQIYLHTFVLAASGEWAVVQQGLNEQTRTARRYHWHSPSVRDFVSAPHTGIVGERTGTILNLVDANAAPAQRAMIDLTRQRPDVVLAEARSWVAPRRHDVGAPDVDLKRLGAVLAVAYERDLRDFASLLLLESLGPRTLQSLALIAEVVHGTPARFDDPARFSFALGGKDGHPFPVPLRAYDESLAVLRRGLERARTDGPARENGLRRLDRFVRAIEARRAPEADFEAVVAHERVISPTLRGRTVFDRPARRGQTVALRYGEPRMTLKEMFLAQLDRESERSKRALEQLPEGQADWKPHDKSMPFGYLATLVASIPSWVAAQVQQDQLDLAPKDGSRFKIEAMTTRADFLRGLENATASARKALDATSDDHLMKNWQLLLSGDVVAEGPRHVMIQDAFNHLAHHRGQMTVYLRLMGAKVPALYGPSADDRSFS